MKKEIRKLLEKAKKNKKYKPPKPIVKVWREKGSMQDITNEEYLARKIWTNVLDLKQMLAEITSLRLQMKISSPELTSATHKIEVKIDYLKDLCEKVINGRSIRD